MTWAVRYIHIFHNGEDEEQIVVFPTDGKPHTLTLDEAGALQANLDNALDQARKAGFRVYGGGRST